MNQSARIYKVNPSPRSPLAIDCFRDGKRMMTLKVTSRREAERLAHEWNTGASMARIAELTKN